MNMPSAPQGSSYVTSADLDSHSFEVLQNIDKISTSFVENAH